MSIVENIIENAVENVVENVAEKQKKQVLSGKYSKFLGFSFWLSSLFEDEEIKAQLYNKIHLYGTIDEQTEFFEQFLAEEKNIAKAVRKHIADHNKPPKPVKAKAPKKGKAVVHQDELISQLIADANSDPLIVVEKVDKEAAKAAKAAEKEAAKAAKEAEKEAAKAAKEAEKEAAKAAKEAEKEAAKAAKEAEKAAKAQEKAAKGAKKAKPLIVEVVQEPVAVEAPAPEPVVEQVAEPEPVVEDELVAEAIVVEAPVKATKAQEKAAKEAEKAAAKAAKEAEKAAKAQEKASKGAKKAKPVVAEVAQEPVVEAPAPEPVQPVAEPEPVVEHELVAEVIEEVKPAPKAKAAKGKSTKAQEKPAKKTKAEKKAKPEPVVEEEEEIQTRIATINGNNYLIDQDFNVYEYEEPHDHIGKYNQDTGAIEPCEE